jgi:anti-anti-sigma factor
MPLSCKVSKAPVSRDTSILTLSGEINSETISSLDEALQVVMQHVGTDLIVNLTGVTYISSAGWRMFLKCARNSAAKLRFVGMQSMVQDVYDLLGFQKVFQTYESMAEALRDVETTPTES